MITTAYLKQLIEGYPVNFKKLCNDANVPVTTIYKKIYYKNLPLKPFEEERLRERLNNLRQYLEIIR